MKNFRSLTIIFLGLLSLFSSYTFARPGVDHLHNVLIFQVGETRLLLDSSVIQNVTATKNTSGTYTLNITLVPSEAGELTNLTQSNIGKNYSVILNKKTIGPTVISSAMSASFSVSGFNKEEAENFVHHINAQK
jgi:preprotein translocase subunit SecD